MSRTAAQIMADAYCATHRQALALAERTEEAQLAWRAPVSAQSAAFHLWHIARWADHLQAAIPGMTAELGARLGARPQLWVAGGYAARWGWDAAGLGFDQTGMSMGDDAAGRLPLPPKPELLAYMRAAIDAAEQAIRAIDDAQFVAPEQRQPLTDGIWIAGSVVGAAVTSHLTHASRHLGMVEALRGLQQISGTATI